MTRLLDWLGTGHERRAKLLACLALVAFAVASIGVLAAPDYPRQTVADEPPENNTLVALQGYKHEGKAIEVAPDGEVVWEYAQTDDVFDVEALGPDRVQIATADEVSDAKCPDRYRNDGFKNCVRNSLRIVEQSNNSVVWEYAWYDVELHEHELHDADHYTVPADGGNASAADGGNASTADGGNTSTADGGNTSAAIGREDRWVMVDMGNDRVFAVNRQKEVVWEWNATDTYDRPAGMGPEGDWTHVNDVDRLRPGVFQVSLRNFDTVVELHVENGSGPDDRAVTVEPVVGPNQFAGKGGPLYEQHNPDRLADGHLLVADSEHDRVVELNQSGEVVWEFGGSGTLDWPRDADRQSNGHTLVTDSYNDRVVELNEEGKIVWAVETGALPYEADRLPAEWSDGARAEGSSHHPTADEAGLADGGRESLLGRYGGYVTAISKYVLPTEVGENGIPLVSGGIALLGAVIEGLRWRGARLRSGGREGEGTH